MQVNENETEIKFY